MVMRSNILILYSECGSEFINTYTHTHIYTYTMLHIFPSACWIDQLRQRNNTFLPCRDYTAKEITNVHIYCGKIHGYVWQMWAKLHKLYFHQYFILISFSLSFPSSLVLGNYETNTYTLIPLYQRDALKYMWVMALFYGEGDSC